MRTFLHLLLATALLTACTGAPEPAPAPPAPAPAAADTAGTVRLTPLSGSGLRFDGVYHTNSSNLHYYMRFFERGNVALVAGHQSPTDTIHLAALLSENVQSGWNNVHNVPVTLRNDSILFQTMSVNGAITYAGKLDGDTVRFLKASRINGKRAIVAYGFEPDGASK